MAAGHVFLPQDIRLAIEVALVREERPVCNWRKLRQTDAFTRALGWIARFSLPCVSTVGSLSVS